ncbi:hypothetical protein NQ318_012420 [Aromia moschata]|uniref:Histone-lysine N-methyltransferase set-23 n=1 Tax=Aromia moschata TaxID=1265417 RepID=A0AAV8Y383_9CUCU|nr:hypothetical protein NQ318_012420 [Aromia moschata]
MEFADEYTHEIQNCLPTKEVEDLYEYELQGCECEINCEIDNCACLQRSGTFYNYNDVLELRNYSVSEKNVRGPTYECNENCKCKEKICGNRLVQFGPRKSLEVRPCEDPAKGLGLFTTDEINEGNFICEYAGEIITELEASKRFRSNGEQNKMNYVFCINENFGERTSKTFIDPTYYGNIGRYINHSCEPNCKLLVIRVNDTMPILGVFADQNIEEKTEITYDYGDAEKSTEGTTSHRKICHCNSKNCRKYLPFNINLT